jgi:hypothetical protein
MSASAAMVDELNPGLPDDPATLVRRRIQQARTARKPFEPTWLSNLAFTAGKHYHVYDRFSRQMMLPPDLEQDAARGNLYVADVITERRQRALGELSGDDDRPELLLVDEGDTNEDFQAQLNRAVGYGWDYEWKGDETLLDLRRKVLDFGTAAIRVRFDPTVGQVKQQLPYQAGKPVLDLEQARGLMANGPREDVKIGDVREGRIRWETLTPFNLLVPPGIEHERDFPWEVVMRPVPLDEVKAQYGQAAAGLTEDTDIASIIGLDTRTGTGNTGGDTSAMAANTTTARLRDHVWVFTYYEAPSVTNPKGRVLVLASNRMVLLTPNPEPLPYCAPDGTYRSGITYFHWWRVTGRFWSRSLIEPMKDIQRRINKRANQIDKTIDRGQPFVLVDKNGGAAKRKGFPVELLALEPSERQPVVSSGIQPGTWMYQDKSDAIEDLDRASGIGQVALGENPQNVNTYAQLAQLNEQEAAKRTVIRKEHQLAIGRLVEDSVHDIRTYWGPDKQVMLDSDDDKVEARVFNATKVPTFFIVRTAKGSAKPRSQAAELQKVSDIWNAALGSTAVQQDPARWVKWFQESLQAGQAADLPEEPNDAQTDKAELENHLLNQGQQVTPAYYDSPQVHIPVHRDAQTEADMAGDAETVALIEQHIQQHIQLAQQVAEQQAQLQAQQQVAQMSADTSQQQIQQATQPQQQPGQPPQSPPAQ